MALSDLEVCIASEQLTGKNAMTVTITVHVILTQGSGTAW